MGEMVNALKNISKLPSNALIQFPSGRWGYVGSVDMRLAFVRKDGTECTAQDVENAAIAGPAFAGLKTKAWDTKDAAIAAAAAIGIVVA
jgi:hypothetical protein